MPRTSFRTIPSLASQSPEEVSDYFRIGLGCDLGVASPQAGRFKARIGIRCLGTVPLVTSHYRFGAIVSFPSPPSKLGILLVDAGGQVQRVGSHDVHVAAGEVLIADMTTLREARLAELNVSRFIGFARADAETALATLLGRKAAMPLGSHVHLDTGSTHARSIAAIVSAIEESISAGDLGTTMPFAVRMLKQAALMAALEALPFYRQLADEASRPQISSWQLQQAMDFIHAQSEPVSVTDVAAAAGLGLRALELAFMKQLGVTPHAYLKRARLDAARSEICSAPPDISITTIARRWGFLNTGKFAADFRAAFGETPSEARRRVR